MKLSFNNLFDLLIASIFGLTFFSIPACSFLPKLNLVTWVLTFIFLVFVIVYLFKNKKFKIDYVAISFVVFALSSLLSSALNFFKSLTFTPIFLSLFSFIVYVYCLNNRPIIPKLLYAAFIGDVLFLFLFIFVYKNEIISLDFNRLGRAFGDQNDIALFFGFGTTFCLYIIYYNKKTILKICSFPLTILFAIGGVSTGSKIFILIVAFSFVTTTFLFFGKRKLFISLIIVIAFFALCVFLLLLPPLKPILNRLLSFFSTFAGKNIGDGTTHDISTIDRLNMFECGIFMFLQKPLFGWGICGFSTFSGLSNSWSHNNISESLCNFGLMGTIFFHYGFFDFLKSYKHCDEKRNYHLYLIILIFYLVCMLSVALNSQKLYAYIIPIVFASLPKTNLITIKDFFRAKNYENS